MKIFDKYIIKEFSYLFLFVLVITISIYIIVDFFEKVDHFIVDGIVMTDIIKYYSYKIPLIISQMTPVAVLLGTIICVCQLSKSNEITVIKSCGISILRFSAPVIGTSVLITFLSFLGNEYLIPLSSKKANDILKFDIKKEKDKGIQKRSKIWYHSSDNLFWNIDYFDPQKNYLKRIRIFIFDDNNRLKERIDAKSAKWGNEEWIFNDITKRSFGAKGDINTLSYKTKGIKFLEKPIDFKKIQKKVEEMSFSELNNYIKRIEIEGFDSTRYKVELHSKFTFPIISIIMSLVGIPFSLRSNRSRGITFGVGVSFIIGFSYWIIFSMGVSLGRAGVLPPFLAAWGASAIFFFGGIYLLLTVKQ